MHSNSLSERDKKHDHQQQILQSIVYLSIVLSIAHLKLPSIQDMIPQENVGMVYKAINNQAPEFLSVLFNRVSVLTGRTIRNANINLRPPAVKHHPCPQLI